MKFEFMFTVHFALWVKSIQSCDPLHALIILYVAISNDSVYIKETGLVANAGFQFLDLYLSNRILSGSLMTSSFVWNQILL